jgi:hypothetical protein
MNPFKMLGAALFAGALALGAGCSKQNPPTTPTTAEVQTGATYEAPEDESVFNKAWDSITDGAEDVADAGEWTLEKAEDGATVAWRKTKDVAGKVGQETGDTAVLSAVKSRFTAAGLSITDIDVDVDEGEVELNGQVGSRADAARAVRIALETRGVDRVTSRLTWR